MPRVALDVIFLTDAIFTVDDSDCLHARVGTVLDDSGAGATQIKCPTLVLSPLDNDRYPDMSWTSVRDVLATKR
jgi:hypothetical protein